MALQFERVVAEDLNLGTGKVRVTMPGGGVALGNQICLDLLPAGLGATAGTVLVSNGASVAPSWSNPALLSLASLPTYADEAAASSLATGRLYRTSTGEVRVKL
jgi:hypothetical protein